MVRSPIQLGVRPARLAHQNTAVVQACVPLMDLKGTATASESEIPGYRPSSVAAVWAVSLSLLVTGAVTAGACRSEDSPASGDGATKDPVLLDWERGTYRGVRLGDSSANLIRVFGQPEERGPHERLEPIGQDFNDIGGPTNYHSPQISGDYEVLRYRRLVFSVIGGKVTSWGTTDRRAQTPEGVGVGDSQALVKRRYQHANCFIQNEGTEYPTSPICKIRVCEGRLLAFGGDPVRSIWLAAETKTGLKSCRRPR